MKSSLFSLALLTTAFATQTKAAPLMNAASPQFGARASVTTGLNAVPNQQTPPSDLLDGNAHSRAVFTGAPYTISISLPFKVMIEKISFAQSDYDKEAAPKEIEIAFDNGPKIPHTLQLSRPVKRKISWQDLAVNREVQNLEITVLSNYDGEVKWGGLAEIALWTPTDLNQLFRVPNHDDNAPVFIHSVPKLVAAPIKVILPPVAEVGEHPRLLLTPQELKDLRSTLPTTERGRAALKALLDVANGTVDLKPNFPDPKGPGAQLKDRGDALAQRHSLLSRQAGTLGMAYALTDDKKYAKTAAEILRGYARLYQQYPEHKGANGNDTSKVMAQRLSEAMWLIPLVMAADNIWNSGELSDADKTQIENGLIRPAIAMIRRKDSATEARERDAKNPNWRTEKPAPSGHASNWLIFYNTATMMSGALLNDRNMMDLAAADFRDLLVKGVGEDGLWDEGAIGYQMFALGAMVPGFEVAARQGIDLWSFDNARIKQLFDSPLRYAYPDSTMPGINDSARAALGNWSTMIYDYAFMRFGDPNYGNLINQSPRQLFPSDAVYAPTRLYEKMPAAPATSASSTLFANLGYAILRDASKYALLDYGPHGGVHGHYDKLNLLLFARGENSGDEMGGEPQFHRYEDALHGEWTTQTVAHNTMTVDEQSQMAGEGRLLLWEDTPQVKLMRAESTSSYPGVLLDRTVLVTPDAVIDLFHGRSPTAHKWDRTFRFDGKLNQLTASGTKALGNSDGFQHFQVASQKPAPEMWQADWQTKAGQWNVTLAGAPTQETILGAGPDKDEMMIARQNGNQADFAAVYALEGWKNPIQNARWISVDDNRSVWEMTQQDGTTTRVIIAHKSGEWQADKWKSDAQVLYVRSKGEEIQLLVGGGSFAQNGALQFRGAAAGNHLMQARNGKIETLSTWIPKP